MATPNMGLGQTQQGVTPAPTYAQLIDANWPLVDQHNHAPGAGVLVPTAGLNINADLNFNSHAILAASSVTTGNLAAAALTANLNLGGYALSNGGSLALTGAGTALTVSNNALVSGNLSVTGTLAAGSLSLTNLTVTGTSTLATINASGLLTLTGAGLALSVTNNATIGGTLLTSGQATLNGGAVMGGPLAMGAQNITNANNVSAVTVNTTNLSGFTSTGNIALGGNTISGGPGSFTTLGASGNLSVTGTTSLTGTLTAGGGSFATGVTFQGSGTGLTVNNNATITGTLTVGGLSLTNLSLSGTLSVTGVSTLTGGIATSLKVGASVANSVTLTGTATGTDPTITLAGDANRNLQITPAGTGLVSINNTVSSTAASVTLGSIAATAGSGTLWGVSSASATGSNYALASNGTTTSYNATTNISFGINNATQVANFTSALAAIKVPVTVAGSVSEATASTALSLIGNAAATGGVGTILDNTTAQTSGTVTSFRTGGTEVANVDYAGDLTITGTFIKTTNSILNVTGNAPATSGNALIINNAIPQTSGNIVSARTANVEQAIITATGDFKPYGHYRSKQTTAPTFTAVNAVFVGATVAFTAGSNDCAGQITVTTTVATGTVSAGAAAFSVNFYQNYTDNFPVVILLPNNTAAGALGITFFTTGNNSGFNVCPSTSWSPAEVAYAFKYWVIDVS